MTRSYWIGLLFCILLGGLLLAFKDQINGHNKIKDLWIGSYHHLDKNVNTPLPLLYDFEQDSLQLIRLSIQEASKKKSLPWRWSGSNLRIDTNLILHQNIKLENSALLIGQNYPDHFRRPKPVNLDAKAARISAGLSGKVWDSETEQLHFKDASQVLIFNKQDHSIHQYCWTVTQYKSYFFLIVEGNPSDCKGYPHFSAQIVKWDSESFRLEKFHQTSVQLLDYKFLKSFDAQVKADPFQSCNPFLHLYYPPHRYYYQDTRYKGGGLYAIRKIFANQYQIPSGSIANGLIRVRFLVNCKGQAGNFELLSLDQNYQEKPMDINVTQQILELCKSLQSWIPGKNSETNESIDTFKYLSFKIKDGAITDIFP